MVAPTQERTSNARRRPELSRDPRDLVSMTVDQIMSRYGIGQRGAYDLKKRASSQLIDVSSVSQNQKTAILEILYRQGGAKNIAMLRSFMKQSRPDIDPHALVHVVWAMQKDGHVRFRERKNSPVGTEGSLERIKLSPSGLAEAKRRFGAKVAPEPIVERQATAPAPVNQNEKPVIGENGVSPHTPGSLVRTSARQENTPAQYGLDPERYPLITALMGRSKQIARYTQAARLLEDDEDLALQVLERIRISPIEQEIVQLVSELPRRV